MFSGSSRLHSLAALSNVDDYVKQFEPNRMTTACTDNNIALGKHSCNFILWTWQESALSPSPAAGHSGPVSIPNPPIPRGLLPSPVKLELESGIMSESGVGCYTFSHTCASPSHASINCSTPCGGKG